MWRDMQRYVISLFILTAVMFVLVQYSSGAEMSIRLVVNPDRTTFHLDDGEIALTARVRGKNLRYTWELIGPGKLDGEGSAIFYVLPDRIDGPSVKSLVTVTVSDESGKTAQESVTFTLLPAQSGTSTVTTPEKVPDGSFSLKDLEQAAQQAQRQRAGITLRLTRRARSRFARCRNEAPRANRVDSRSTFTLVTKFQLFRGSVAAGRLIVV